MTPQEMELQRQLLRNQTPTFGMPSFGNMFNGFGSLFSTPQIPVTRPEVLEQMQNQMIQPPATQQGPTFFNIPGLFGANDQGLTYSAGNQPTNMQNAIASQYNLETGQLRTPEGVFTGKGEVTPEPGMFDALSNMSGEETMNLISGLGGLLSATEPEQQPLKALPMPGASGGLRLPEVDLMQYYKGLL